jgi:hypothetical protein
MQLSPYSNCTFSYLDIDTDSWVEFSATTDLEDLGKIPKLRALGELLCPFAMFNSTITQQNDNSTLSSLQSFFNHSDLSPITLPLTSITSSPQCRCSLVALLYPSGASDSAGGNGGNSADSKGEAVLRFEAVQSLSLIYLRAYLLVCFAVGVERSTHVSHLESLSS